VSYVMSSELAEIGYFIAKEELEKLAYEVKKLTLALSDTFPEDCSLLVIGGAEKDLLPNELETIRNYISKGGKVFFMVDPESTPGFKHDKNFLLVLDSYFAQSPLCHAKINISQEKR